jgi:hypothetical protein
MFVDLFVGDLVTSRKSSSSFRNVLPKDEAVLSPPPTAAPLAEARTDNQTTHALATIILSAEILRYFGKLNRLELI